MEENRMFLGTSGWSYEEWVGPFYPTRQTPKLSYYSSVFETVEVDSSFYAMPTPNLVFGWVKHTPSGFKFSLKLPKTITHQMRLDSRLVEEELRTFTKVISTLISSGKVGVVLAQLPPSLHQDQELLEKFLSLLPLDTMKFAVEFRHSSWWNEETWSLLRKNKVANTIVDEPLLPPDLVVTAPHVYLRWHGRGKRVWYDYRYNRDEIQLWSVRLGQLKSKEVYGYWNNHFHGNAVLNCLEELAAISGISERQREVLEGMKSREGAPRTLLDFESPS